MSIEWAKFHTTINTLSLNEFVSFMQTHHENNKEFEKLDQAAKHNIMIFEPYQRFLHLAETTLTFDQDFDPHPFTLILEKNMCCALQKLRILSNFNTPSGSPVMQIKSIKFGKIRMLLKNNATVSYAYMLWNTILSYLLIISHHFICTDPQNIEGKILHVLFLPFDTDFRWWLIEFIFMIKSIHQLYHIFPVFLIKFFEQYAIPQIFLNQP